MMITTTTTLEAICDRITLAADVYDSTALSTVLNVFIEYSEQQATVVHTWCRRDPVADSFYVVVVIVVIIIIIILVLTKSIFKLDLHFGPNNKLPSFTSASPTMSTLSCWRDFADSAEKKTYKILAITCGCPHYNTIRYDSVYLTCSKKLTGSQLSPPHGANKKLICETKNKTMSMIGPVQSRCHEGSPVGKRSLRWEGFVEKVGFEPGVKEWRSDGWWEWWW